MKQRARVGGPFLFPKVLGEPSCGIALKTRLKHRPFCQDSARSRSRRASLCCRRRSTKRTAAYMRTQRPVAGSSSCAQMASGEVVVGREHFEAYWPRYLRHAKADMTQGSWDDVRAHGSKRLLPFFNGMQMSHPTPPAVSSDARPGAAVAGDEALHILKVNLTWAPMRTHGNLPALTSRSTVSVDSPRYSASDSWSNNCRYTRAPVGGTTSGTGTSAAGANAAGRPPDRP